MDLEAGYNNLLRHTFRYIIYMQSYIVNVGINKKQHYFSLFTPFNLN